MEKIRTSPVILNLTNYVAMMPCANALLALGASPIMSLERAEMEELTGISSAVAINIGCLEQGQVQAMETAAEAASRTGKPWVLDPAGAGASRFRTETVLRLIDRHHPSIIRGNAAEILAICGREIRPAGIDSAEESSTAIEAAESMASETGAVIVISGPTDYITDGHRTLGITGGSPMMSKVTAMGCISSAVCAAFSAVTEDAYTAASRAMKVMSAAGEKAAAKSCGTGSFAINFIDELNGFSLWTENF